MCFWINFHGGGIQEWAGFLKKEHLATPSELKAMRKFELHGTNMFEFMERHHELFGSFINPKAAGFKQMILAQFD